MKGGDRTRPISIALGFGLHAILTSVFVLQGDGDLAKIAAYARQSYYTMFQQLKDSVDQEHSPENSPNTYRNIGLFVNLKNFARPVPSTYDSRAAVDLAAAEQLAFWNPFIGGEYMLYATYVCSINLGSATVDSLGQLRFTLHLYNALRSECPTFKIPFLEAFDKVFDGTKAVWVVGTRPTSGSYCKHFWMSWGMAPSHAAQKAKEIFGVGEGEYKKHLEGQVMRSSDGLR
jgi:hypothetical protein